MLGMGVGRVLGIGEGSSDGRALMDGRMLGIVEPLLLPPPQKQHAS